MAKTFFDLEQKLFSGLSERPIWSQFLRTLAQICNAPAAFFVIEGLKPIRNMTATVSPDAQTGAQFSEHLNLAKLMSLPPDQPLITDIGAGESPVVRLSLASGRSAWLVLQEGQGAPSVCLDLLAYLIPTLHRALPIYEVLAESERARRVAEYVLETSGTGILLVDADGHLVRANSVARVILADAKGLSVGNGQISAGSPATTRAVLEAVADMASLQSAKSDPHAYVALAVDEPTRIHPLTLIIRPGPPYGPVSAPIRRTAVIIVRDPARPAMLSNVDLERLFGLTPAEAKLASRLADGDGLEEAALGLGISRNTARSQLQAVYLKTGVNRQGDLVRLLLRSAASQVSAPIDASSGG